MADKDKDSVTFPWYGVTPGIWNFNDHNEQENPSSIKVEDVVQDSALINTTTLGVANINSGTYVKNNLGFNK